MISLPIMGCTDIFKGLKQGWHGITPKAKVYSGNVAATPNQTAIDATLLSDGGLSGIPAAHVLVPFSSFTETSKKGCAIRPYGDVSDWHHGIGTFGNYGCDFFYSGNYVFHFLSPLMIDSLGRIEATCDELTPWTFSALGYLDGITDFSTPLHSGELPTTWTTKDVSVETGGGDILIWMKDTCTGSGVGSMFAVRPTGSGGLGQWNEPGSSYAGGAASCTGESIAYGKAAGFMTIAPSSQFDYIGNNADIHEVTGCWAPAVFCNQTIISGALPTAWTELDLKVDKAALSTGLVGEKLACLAIRCTDNTSSYSFVAVRRKGDPDNYFVGSRKATAQAASWIDNGWVFEFIVPTNSDGKIEIRMNSGTYSYVVTLLGYSL